MASQKPASSPADDKEDSRDSLRMDEEEYEEIQMGKNEDLKVPVMSTIQEDVKNEDSAITEDKVEDTNNDKANESMNSFIVNTDYFGEDEENMKMMDSSIDRFTQIGSANGNRDVSYLVSTRNMDNSQAGNDTIDNIMFGLESPGIYGKTSRPTKVKNINEEMENQNYMVIKDASRSDSDLDNFTMNNQNLAKGSKAWKDWWKKKRSNCEDLLMAAESGDLQKVKNFLDKDVYKEFVPNIKFEGLDKYTALHFAAQEGHYETCKFLIEKGANLEAKSSIGRTPLHLVSLRDNHEIAKLLIDNGADVNCQDVDMYTPLHYASEMGNTMSAEVLVSRGADVSLKNNLGSRPGDISQNVDVRSVITQHETDNDLCQDDSGTKRATFHNVVLRNDRKNYVTRLMDKYQKVDKYLKNNVNGNEEALIQNIEKQQKMREEAKRRERGLVVEKEVPSEKSKKKKKLGKFEQNRDKFIQIVQFENKMKMEYDNFGSEQDVAGPALFNPVGRLGKGSFGEVYLVEKLPEGNFFAMKILHKRKIMGQNLVRYARTERDVLSYFDHPFIVSIAYAFQTPEKLYMILEYCPGGDLGSVLKREKKLSEERAKLYMAEIILALEELHKKDIIFRDLKPDNVVLDADGHAMLTDFGLSKEGVNNNSSAKSFCGSVAYLAPEVLRRQGHGKSVDWYLVGVLLYEMLVGIPPYFSSNKDQMFKNIKNGPLKMPERLTAETKDFIVKLLNKNPSKRLGAGKKDAEELKTHDFFKGVNWEDVIQRKQVMPKAVVREVKRNSSVNLRDIVYGEYAGVGEVASSKKFEFEKALHDRGHIMSTENPDADDLDRNKIPGWSFIGQ